MRCRLAEGMPFPLNPRYQERFLKEHAVEICLIIDASFFYELPEVSSQLSCKCVACALGLVNLASTSTGGKTKPTPGGHQDNLVRAHP
jgi:hypothetical protein